MSQWLISEKEIGWRWKEEEEKEEKENEQKK